jgi:flagellin
MSRLAHGRAARTLIKEENQMGLRINTNTDALDAYRNLSMTQSKLSDSLQKLSSGYRINKAADDAAGLSISQGLQAQIGGLTQAVKNAQDGINVVQTADGALTEVDSILQRMNSLAVQAANTGSQDTTARQAAQTELQQLNADLDNIGSTTQFGNSHLLNGTFGIQAATTSSLTNTQVQLSGITGDAGTTLTLAGSSTATATVKTTASAGDYTDDAAGAAKLQTDLQSSIDGGALAGLVTAKVDYDSLTGKASVSFTRTSAASSADTLTATADGVLGAGAGTAATSGSGGVFQIGAEAGQVQNVSIGSVSASALKTDNLDLVGDASGAISVIKDAITAISTERAQLGAYQNGFQHTINNLNVTVENLQASNSSIQDTDMASEMVNFTKEQVLQQAGVAMLAQANSASQSVLKLLG